MAPRRDQEFLVSLWPLDWTRRDTENFPFILVAQPSFNLAANVKMHGRITNNAPLTDAFSTGLELGLNQRHKPSARRGKRQGRRQHRSQADEACIAHDEIDGLGDFIVRQMPGVDALEHDDTRIIAETPIELAATNVDRVNAPSLARQEDIGKPTGRRADIDSGAPARIDSEMLQCMGELDAAARDPGMVLAAYFEGCVYWNGTARFVDAPIGAEHDARQYKGIGLGSAVGEATLHQQLICARLLDHVVINPLHRLASLGERRTGPILQLAQTYFIASCPSAEWRPRSVARWGRTLGSNALYEGRFLTQRAQGGGDDCLRVETRQRDLFGRRIVVEEGIRHNHRPDLQPSIQGAQLGKMV